MATYITLWRLTDQGMKNIKNSPRRVETTVKAVEEVGGKMKGVYVTMGEYDFVTVADAPSDEQFEGDLRVMRRGKPSVISNCYAIWNGKIEQTITDRNGKMHPARPFA